MKLLIFSFLILGSSAGICQLSADSIYKENAMYRAELNAHYSDSLHSPLKGKALKEFDSIPFYPIDTNYYVVAKFIKVKNGKSFKMKTSSSRRPEYKLYAKAIFTLRDTIFTLTIYQNVGLTKRKGFENFLFLPFNDFTNGNETYGGGRYLDLLIPEGDSIVLDFNQAYNPYCAYTAGYSCPVPPRENSLQTYIQAGVKFEGK